MAKKAVPLKTRMMLSLLEEPRPAKVYGKVFGDLEQHADSEKANNASYIALAQNVTVAQHGMMDNLFHNGPLQFGVLPDVATILIANGVVEQVIVKGEDGWYALTAKGGWLYRCYNAIKEVQAEES